MGFCCIIIGKFHVQNEKDLPNRFRPAHTFLYFSCKLSIIIVITAAMFDFLKILNMGFCCTIKGKFHLENEKDLPYRFRPAHTFLYFSCKLLLIIVITAAMLDFSKIWNMGFCCFIIGRFHAKSEKDPPYRFRPAHTVTHTHTHTDAHTHAQGASDNHPKFSIENCWGAKKPFTWLLLKSYLCTLQVYWLVIQSLFTFHIAVWPVPHIWDLF